MVAEINCLKTNRCTPLPWELSRSPPDTYGNFPPPRGAHGNRTWEFGFLPSHRPERERKQSWGKTTTLTTKNKRSSFLRHYVACLNGSQTNSIIRVIVKHGFHNSRWVENDRKRSNQGDKNVRRSMICHCVHINGQNHCQDNKNTTTQCLVVHT